MGWFGGGTPANTEDSNFSTVNDGFSSGDSAGFGGDGGSSMSSAGAGMTGSGAAGLQAFAEQQQQVAMFNQVVGMLSKIAFDKCVDKPSSELSSYEQRCIEATSHKYLDGQKFVVGRMKRTMQG